MKKIFLGLFLSAATSFAQRQSPFVLGETITLPSEILKEDRTLNIYLPAGYSPDSAKTYPVIYLLDGSADEDFIHVAGLVQFLNFPWIASMPESILVGIGNVDRRRDYTFPTTVEEDKTNNPTSGHSAEFISFIQRELMPFMSKNFKTNGENSLVGQSLGGLLASEILIRHTDLFTRYFIVSPSLWWNNFSLLKENFSGSLAGKSVFVAVGKEGKEMVPPAKQLVKKIKSTGGENLNLVFKYYPHRTHADILHEALMDGFELIY